MEILITILLIYLAKVIWPDKGPRSRHVDEHYIILSELEKSYGKEGEAESSGSIYDGDVEDTDF